MPLPSIPKFQDLTITRATPPASSASPDLQIYIITMHRHPENRLTPLFAQSIIQALRHIESVISSPSSSSGSTSNNSAGPSGAVILRGSDMKYWCTGLDLEVSSSNPTANSDGFYPLVACLLDYPYPTIAMLTGHTFGGAVPLALACDYRIMNSKRGFVCMPPVDLGLHFEGIGVLPQTKLGARVARKMLLEAHRWTGEEAVRDGVVDEICEPEKLEARCVEVAAGVGPRARMGVYGLLRGELWGEAVRAFRGISYVHSKRVGREAKAKI
ncbi:MAG: hypothetical protein Q9227_002803 [Pyrenula ochraceoflavens]